MNRRRNNNISMIKNESGNWVEDSNKIKNMVINFYKNLFSLDTNWNRWRQTQISYVKLTEVDVLKLNIQVSNKEIHKTLSVHSHYLSVLSSKRSHLSLLVCALHGQTAASH